MGTRRSGSMKLAELRRLNMRLEHDCEVGQYRLNELTATRKLGASGWNSVWSDRLRVGRM